MTHGFGDLRVAIATSIADEGRVAATVAARRSPLPLRYWGQQAHYTVPAADVDLARKALEDGTRPMARIIDRLGVGSRDIADTLGIPERQVADLLEHPRLAPLVMLDGEDAQALRVDVIDAGVRVAADLIAHSSPDARRLMFFRPPGFGLGSTAPDLFRLLDGIARSAEDFRLDGIVFPKLEHPEEVDLLDRHLGTAERAIGLEPGRIRVGLLVESGWALMNLSELVRRAAPRLSAIIFGLADFSADLGLDAIRTEHPVADLARAAIVAAAGGAGVPAIDGMTVDYPVADPTLDAEANRSRFLARLALVHDDARRSMALGMSGKWVGHPAQLFAVLLAFDQAYEGEQLELEAQKVEAYRRAVDLEGRGAIVIDGVMSDRATDRHARERLRRAVACGRFPAARAIELGIVDRGEVEAQSG